MDIQRENWQNDVTMVWVDGVRSQLTHVKGSPFLPNMVGLCYTRSVAKPWWIKDNYTAYFVMEDFRLVPFWGEVVKQALLRCLQSFPKPL